MPFFNMIPSDADGLLRAPAYVERVMTGLSSTRGDDTGKSAAHGIPFGSVDEHGAVVESTYELDRPLLGCAPLRVLSWESRKCLVDICENCGEYWPDLYRYRINDTGEMAAFDAICHENSHPGGEIAVYPVLVLVLMFLPPHDITLMRISAVSRAWRIAASALPQWSLAPRLIFVFDSRYRRNALILRQSTKARTIEDNIVQVATHEGFVAAMRERWKALRALRQSAGGNYLWIWRGRFIHFFYVLQVAAATINVALIFVVLSVVGWSAPEHGGSDWSTGTTAFFIGAFGALVSVATQGLIHRFVLPLAPTPQDAERHGLAHTPLIVVIALVGLVLSVPHTLLTARVSQLSFFVAQSSRLTCGTDLSATSATNLAAMTAPPAYLGIFDLGTWVARPYPNTTYVAELFSGGCKDVPIVEAALNESANMIALLSPTNRTPWWSDAVIAGSTTCYDAENNIGVPVFYLWPPAACWPSLPPVAVWFDPKSSGFASALQSMQQSEGWAWFRVPVPSSWFSPINAGQGTTWFTSPEWTVQRIALVNSDLVEDPEAVLDAHWWTVLICPLTAALALCGAVACIVVAAPTADIRLTDKVSKLGTLLLLNPIWALFFGVLCSPSWAVYSTSVCMLDGTAVDTLITIGTFFGIMFTCILLGCLC